MQPGGQSSGRWTITNGAKLYKNLTLNWYTVRPQYVISARLRATEAVIHQSCVSPIQAVLDILIGLSSLISAAYSRLTEGSDAQESVKVSNDEMIVTGQ